MKLCSLSFSAVKWIVVMAVLLSRAGWAADEAAGGASESALSLSNQVTVAAQWREPVAPGAGGDTLEIFLSNMSSNLLTFTSADMKNTGAVAGIFWRQFYPTTNAAPGETIVYRLCFEKAPPPGREKDKVVVVGAAVGNGSFPVRSDPDSDLEPGRPRPAPSSLSNAASGSATLSVPLPPFRAPEKTVTAIAYSLDYDKIFIQCRSPNAALRKLWINGREVATYSCLSAAEPGLSMVVVCKPPLPIKTGHPVFVRLQFKDGLEGRALVRALNGAMLDAYLIPDKERTHIVARLGLDETPAVIGHTAAWGGDVACHDTRYGQGKSAEQLIAERIKMRTDQPDKLAAIHFCTGYFTALWNIYGPLSDTALVSPYSLSHGYNVSRFIDDEEQFMERGRLSTRPAPWLWIPDVFQRKPRFIEPDELRTLAWVALLRGCKGFKYFAYHLDMKDQGGFDKCPPLLEAIAELNKTIRTKRAIIAPLIPVSANVVGDPNAGIKVYTAWAGDQGMLALVRNLDYTTDDQANDNGRAPRFKANAKTNVTVTLSVPDWLQHDGVSDFLTDEKCDSTPSVKGPEVTLPLLDVFKVLWLENMASAVAALGERDPSVVSAVAPAVSAGSGTGQIEQGAKGGERGVSDNGQPATDNRQLIINRLLVICALGACVLIAFVWAARRRK